MIENMSTSVNRESLDGLVPCLSYLVEGFKNSWTNHSYLESIEILTIAAQNSRTGNVNELVVLHSFKDVLPICHAVLSYFEESKLNLNYKVERLLSACIEVVVKEVNFAIAGDEYTNYPQESTSAINSLYVYVSEKSGFNLGYNDDNFIKVKSESETIDAELEYLSSILQVDKKKQLGGAVKKELSEKIAKEEKRENAITKEKIPEYKNKKLSHETTRVKSHLLETLMSYSEELVQIRNVLADISTKSEDQGLSELSNRLATVSNNILSDLLRTRLRSIGIVFSRYQRSVRELSKDLGKKVDLKIIGENIEIDSNVIDAITEPLLHLVRNSIDHGIETPEERIKLGKSETGRLTLHAYNEPGKVVIRVGDDGKGIIKQKILKKAINAELVTSEAAQNLSDKEVLNFVFSSGLSTSENVTSISGRGVGLDAVRRNVEEIQGEIEIHSEEGKGTDFILRFPLTMATIKVILFKIDGVNYAIPSKDVSQILRLSKNDSEVKVRFENEQSWLHRDNKIIPLIEPNIYLDNLGQVDSIKESYYSNTATNIIIIRHQQKEWGLCVDEVMSFLDIVIKPMSPALNPAHIFNGLALLGNGELAYILSLKGLLNSKKSGHTFNKNTQLNKLIETSEA